MIAPLIRGLGRYTIDHWQGNHSLARSVFINTFGPNLAIRLIDNVVAGDAEISWGNSAYIIYFTTLIISCLAIAIWQSVGIFRRALRIRAAEGWNVGTIIAAIYAPTMFCIVLFQLYGLSLINARFVEIAFGLDKELAEYEVGLLNDSEIFLDGGITDKSVKAVERILDRSDDVSIIHLTSIGGYVGASQKLIDLIQKHNLETYVSWECASACTSAFMASDFRSIGLDGYLGFHISDCPGGAISRSACEETVNLEKVFLRNQGVEMWFVEKVTTTPPDDIWEPTFEDLARAGVITHVFDGESDIDATTYCGENDCTKLPNLSSEEFETS